MRRLLAALLALLIVWPALAEIRVTYRDSYPDEITLTNLSACDFGPVVVTIDLGRSPAGLIFDVSGTGAGYSGHAPLEILGGGEQVLAIGRLSDGDSRLEIELDFLAGAGGRVRLGVDVDDTSPESALGQTIIAGSEIAGAVAEARLGGGGRAETGVFGTDGVAVVPLEACIS